MTYRWHNNSRRRFTEGELYERAKLMYQYYTIEGKTLEQIARIFGLSSRERVRQIIKDFEDKQKQLGLGLDKEKKEE
jgi:DNA-directed RNA polymerase sigma subunit (sigma70/sigma32)